jgi:hypothetical protein
VAVEEASAGVCEEILLRSMALRITSSLRMQAVRATQVRPPPVTVTQSDSCEVNMPAGAGGCSVGSSLGCSVAQRVEALATRWHRDPTFDRAVALDRKEARQCWGLRPGQRALGRPVTPSWGGDAQPFRQLRRCRS